MTEVYAIETFSNFLKGISSCQPYRFLGTSLSRVTEAGKKSVITVNNICQIKRTEERQFYEDHSKLFYTI